MLRQDKLSLLITFVIGIIAGGYLYLTGFATTFKLPEVNTNDVYREFVITADFYGVCDNNRSCISFQLLENGSYRVIVEKGSKNVTKEGVIPRSLRLELNKSLSEAALKKQSKLLDFSECGYDIETENNYNFNISRNEINYVLDTCETEIDYNSEAWASLVKLINYFLNLD